MGQHPPLSEQLLGALFRNLSKTTSATGVDDERFSRGAVTPADR
jgi:hypothetical protein